jgi:hypothetical protein
VVLQDFSRKPVTDPEESMKYFSLFNEEIRRAGAKTIVFENWTRRDKDSEYAPLLAAYQRIQQHTGGIAAPVGTAWRDCELRRPDIHLLLDDRHPSDAGTYLAAAVLYDVIYGKRSRDLPAALKGPKLPAEVKMALRGFADDAVRGKSE